MLYWETGQLLPFIDSSEAALPSNGTSAAATTRERNRGGAVREPEVAPAGAPPSLRAQLPPGLQPQTRLNLPRKSLTAELVSWLAVHTRGNSAGTNSSRDTAAARSCMALRHTLLAPGSEREESPEGSPAS